MSSNAGVVELASDSDSLVEERHAISFHGQCDGPVLNPDVIFYILSFLPKTDLLAAMSTCRALHSAGIKHLLHLCGHMPLGFGEVEPFMRFMLSNLGYFKHLRRLEIMLNDRTPGKITAQGLSQCHWLEYMDISFYGRAAPDTPELDEAICSLPRLTDLIISGSEVADRCTRWFSRIRCPLKFLCTRFYEKTYQDAQTALHPLSEHLEALDICGLSFLNMGLRLPRIRSAAVIFGEFNHDTRVLLHWFPAMTNLCFLRVGLSDAMPWEYGLWDEVRRKNENRRSTNRWPRMEAIEGHFLSIYSAAPICDVHRLCCGDLNIYHAERLSIVLTDLRPRVLELRIELLPQECQLLFKLLQQATSVNELTIRIEFRTYVTNLSEEIMIHLPRALQPLRTRSVTVGFALDEFSQDMEELLYVEGLEAEELEDEDEREAFELARAVHALDAHALAHKIAEQVLSMTQIIIRLPGREFDLAWDISRHDCEGLSLIPSQQPGRNDL